MSYTNTIPNLKEFIIQIKIRYYFELNKLQYINIQIETMFKNPFTKRLIICKFYYYFFIIFYLLYFLSISDIKWNVL